MPYPTGKKPARPGSITLKLGAVLNSTALPTPPLEIGVPAVQNWFMLGNNEYADCVFAGAAHETKLWASSLGKYVPFTTTDVLGDYSAVTGFRINDPSTDQGTDVQTAAAYRQKTGIRDAEGNRHKIDAYAAMTPGDLDELAQAVYLFGAVGVGFQLPASAQAQFTAGHVWDDLSGAGHDGHYVPCVGRNSAGNFLFVTWGRLQAATPAWVAAFMDEAVAYLSVEQLKDNVSPAGYNLDALTQYLKVLT